MKPKIKICGMRDPENMRAVAALKPDFMGFIFYKKSPRFAHPSTLQAAVNALPNSIQKVGVFVNEKTDTIIRTASLLGLDYIQLHGNESVEELKVLKDAGNKVIKVFSIKNSADLKGIQNYENDADFFLFDTKTTARGGSGTSFDWSVLAGLESQRSWFLAGGIGLESIPQISSIKHPGFFAVDANSKLETSPAMKDIELVSSFIKTIRTS
jgi:phosphoribosylanthranilate isomerase